MRERKCEKAIEMLCGLCTVGLVLSSGDDNLLKKNSNNKKKNQVWMGTGDSI